MAPPAVLSTACQSIVDEVTRLTWSAEVFEDTAAQIESPQTRADALRSADQLTDTAVTALQKLTTIKDLRMCSVWKAEHRLIELQARLAAHRADCNKAEAILAPLNHQFTVTQTYYEAARCVRNRVTRQSPTRDREHLLRVTGFAVDHTTDMSAAMASQAWTMYAESIALLDASAPILPPDLAFSLERAIDLDPMNAAALIALADTKMQLGDRAAAGTLYDRALFALQAAPQQEVWWQLRCRIAKSQEDLDGLLVIVHEAMERFPQTPYFHIERLRALESAQRYDELAMALQDSALRAQGSLRDQIHETFLLDIAVDGALDALLPTAQNVATLQAMYTIAPDEPALLVLLARLARRNATTTDELTRVSQWFETECTRHRQATPVMRMAFAAERISARDHLAYRTLETDPQRAAAVFRDTIALATTFLQQHATAPPNLRGRVLAVVADAEFALGTLTRDRTHYLRAQRLWTRYQQEILPVDDPVKIAVNVAGFIANAGEKALLAELATLVSAWAGSDVGAQAADTALANLAYLTSHLMPRLFEHLDLLGVTEEYDLAVHFYKDVAALLAPYPELEASSFAFQKLFFRRVLSGPPFEIAYARALCGDQPSDPLLLLLLAYSYTLAPNTLETAQTAVATIDRAWQQTTNIDPSLRSLFARARLTFYTAWLRRSTSSSRLGPELRTIIPSLDAMADRLTEGVSLPDVDVLALVAAYQYRLGALTKDPGRVKRARQLTEQLMTRADQLMLVPEQTPQDLQPTLWLTEADTWNDLITMYVEGGRTRDEHDHLFAAVRLYAAAARLAPPHDRPTLQQHVYQTVLTQNPFVEKNTAETVHDFSASVFLNGGQDDPLLTYFHVKMRRQHQATKKNPWTADALSIHQENLARFEQVLATTQYLPPELDLPFTIERILQHSYLGKVWFQQLKNHPKSTAEFTTAAKIAEDAHAKYPRVTEIAVDLGWAYYWLAKVTGDLSFHDKVRTLLSGVEAQLRGKNIQERHAQERTQELSRIMGWAGIIRARDLMREERNYAEAERILRAEVEPTVKKVKQLPAESIMARQDAWFLEFSFHYLTAEAIDHERLMLLALLSIRAPLPPEVVSGTDLQRANALRDRAMRVLDRFGPEERKAEVTRARGCALLRKGFKEAQAAVALTGEVLGSHDTKNINNRNAALECHIMSLRLEARISTLPPEKRLSNLARLVLHTKAQLDAQKRPPDQDQLSIAVDDLANYLSTNPHAEETVRFLQCCPDDPVLSTLLAPCAKKKQ